MPIFSHNEQLWIFRPKFEKMAQLHAIFWFNNVEDVTDSWAEINGAGRRWVDLIGGRWSWVEVDRAGWRWVHDFAIPHVIWLVKMKVQDKNYQNVNLEDIIFKVSKRRFGQKHYMTLICK